MKKQAAASETICVHTGTQLDSTTRGVNTPVHTSSAFGYRGPLGNLYPRYYNTPNQQAVVEKLCALEGAEDGLLLSSGMAAISAIVLGLLKQGDHLVLSKEIYGGTHHFITSELARFGISYTFTDSTDPESFAAAIQDNTRLLYIETPSNPLLKLTDIAGVAKLAKEKGLVTAIDNTFASPINQTPIALGIDLVMHSGTKYLGGHSDLCFGAVAGSQELMKQIRAHAINLGGSLNADTCALIERSMKTLALRVERQTQNAQQVAEWLENEAGVKKVNYPGLPSHPQHDLARSQMKGFGAMFSFELEGDAASTEGFLDRLQMIIPALSLGGVETLICAPAKSSHVKMSPQERAEAGVSDTLLRLSLGIEAAEDIIADIRQAMGN
jgi:cystathionine beta-lyase/cystathionine gamma-synthase